MQHYEDLVEQEQTEEEACAHAYQDRDSVSVVKRNYRNESTQEYRCDHIKEPSVPTETIHRFISEKAIVLFLGAHRYSVIIRSTR